MVLRPFNFGKPLIAVVQDLVKPQDFKEDLDSHVLEVIGGNHRRLAIMNLNTNSRHLHQQFVDVQLYCGMCTYVKYIIVKKCKSVPYFFVGIYNILFIQVSISKFVLFFLFFLFCFQTHQSNLEEHLGYSLQCAIVNI